MSRDDQQRLADIDETIDLETVEAILNERLPLLYELINDLRD